MNCEKDRAEIMLFKTREEGVRKKRIIVAKMAPEQYIYPEYDYNMETIDERIRLKKSKITP